MSDASQGGKLVRISGNGLPAERLEYLPAHIEVPATRKLDRNVSILRRYKWLILGVFGLAVLGGLAASRLVTPGYQVAGTIWIQPKPQDADRAAGPMTSGQLLNSSAWVELLESYRIADAVVQKLNLYVRPDNPADTALFRDFRIGDRFKPGAYKLTIDGSRQRWMLATVLPEERVVDSGTVADSIGRSVGLRWALPASLVLQPAPREVGFTVTTPRETAVGLIERLDAELPQNSNFLKLELKDSNPVWAQMILNTWMREFVSVAADLKKRHVVQLAGTLESQLRFAESSLQDAEGALRNFRTRTIMMPGEASSGADPIADPSVRKYFEQKTQYDDLRADREALQKAVAGASGGQLPWETSLLIPSVAQSAGADPLRDAFKQLQAKRAELLTKQQVYTDQHPAVREIQSGINTLETQTIPRLSSRLLVQLQEREKDYTKRLANTSGDLRSIPSRTIEDMRLRRQVGVAENLYTTLKGRHSEAQLAEASATPDISILDSAVAPLTPSSNTAPTVMLTAILLGLGAAVGLALLLDATDKKIRYTEQIAKDLGLPVAGAIPLFPRGGVDARSPEQTSQLVESIRSVRMHLLSSGEMPLSVAISSPSPADGKSFLATNLALSFADAGLTTLLVDGDTRRGKLHEFFEMSAVPGLTDYLSGDSDLESAIRKTSTERLDLMTCGKRRARSPELLTSPTLPALASELRSRYDVVIFDTPPLAAGVDAYAVATAAQNLALVFRIGKTQRRMAASKLALIERLPIRVVGAILNGVDLKGEFEPYRYAYDYRAYDEPSAKELVTTR